MKYMTKMRRERERGGEGGGGGGKEGGVHRVLDHTYPELSVARATLVHTKYGKGFALLETKKMALFE